VKPLRLAVLISGRGSNLIAIDDACREGRLDAKIVFVGSDRAAAGLEAAKARGLPALRLDATGFATRAEHEAAMREAIDAARPDCVVLAGYMRVLGDRFVVHYAGRMLNIHPSLLPRYTGLHTHRRVLEAGDRWHGASVHYVTSELDAGPVVLQGRVPVHPGDDEARLSARVQACEHIIYPRVLQWIASGRLVYRDGPWFDGQPLTAPIVEDFLDCNGNTSR
jgi:phosphoribosylglycinamide formyltransferase-1